MKPLAPARARDVHLIRVGLILGAVAVWYLLSLASSLVASPVASVQALGKQAQSGSLLDSSVSTIGAMLWGFVAAVIIGIPVGYALGRSRLLATAFDPVVASLFAIPRIIFYPLFLGIFGVGGTSKSWLAAISAVFPIIIATAGAIRQIPPILTRLGASLGAPRWKQGMKIMVPSAIGPIMGGIRIGFGVAFVTVIIAELFVAASGLGLAVHDAYAQLSIDAMYGDILFIVLVAFLGSLALWSVERRIRTV